MAHRRENSRWRAIGGGLVALAVVGLASCGGDDDADSGGADVGADAADSDAGDGEAADAGDDGGGDSDGAGASGGSDAAGGGDFPIPAPDGLVLDVLVDSGLAIEGQRQLLYENDDFDRVVAFYDDWTSQGGEWARAEAQGSVTFQSIDGEGVRMISVTPDHDPGAQADGPTTIVLLVASSD